MHLSANKFKEESSSFIGYCGDFNPPQPRWSILTPGKKNSEVGVFLYIEHKGEVEQIRFFLNDTVYNKDNSIESWYLYPYSTDKKDYPFIKNRKIIILNQFNPGHLMIA